MSRNTRIVIALAGVAIVYYLLTRAQSPNTVSIPVANINYNGPTGQNTNPITGIFDTINKGVDTYHGLFG